MEEQTQKNPVVGVRLTATVWRDVYLAIKASPEAGNYLAAEGAEAIAEAMERHGVPRPKTPHAPA